MYLNFTKKSDNAVTKGPHYLRDRTRLRTNCCVCNNWYTEFHVYKVCLRNVFIIEQLLSIMAKKKTGVPILLNYTGHTLFVKLSEGDKRFPAVSRQSLGLKSLGAPRIKTVIDKLEGDTFPTERLTVINIPNPMNGVFFIVTEEVARVLYSIRKDLMIVINPVMENAKNPLHPMEMKMTGDDIAATLLWIAELPPHLNINRLELMPVSQSFAGFQVARKG